MLGHTSARVKNIALLAKLNWRLYQEKDSLWTKVILKKYCSQSQRNSKDLGKLSCSPCWTAVKKGFSIFAKEVCWSVEKNSSPKF